MKQERALLVSVLLPTATHHNEHNPLGELLSLAETAGARIVDCVIARRKRIDPAYYVGKGKARELGERAESSDAEVIIFDNDLSPAQIRDLEGVTERKIIDRSELILDIFASRAQTHEAKLQVELAQLEYTAPRLRGMWSHLERIAGAGGATGAGAVGGIGTRGPGERQIEIDRRLVSKRLSALKRQIAEIDRRKLREVKARHEFFNVSLVGYTNAGKSTMMNALTGAGVNVEDKLFATLGTKTHKWDLGGGKFALLSDTVGFVRDLPHRLVASFRATLEEAIHADLLLHVVDSSAPDAEAQMATVDQVLDELGCGGHRKLVLLNKADVATDPAMAQMLEAQAGPNGEVHRVSAKTGVGLPEVVSRVCEIVVGPLQWLSLRVPSGDGRALAYVERHARIIDRVYADHRLDMTVRIGQRDLSRLRELYSAVEVLAVAPAE